MNELLSYVFAPLRKGDISLSRGSGNGLAPIRVVAAEASLGCIEGLEHEYALKGELDANWAARPVSLTHYNGRMTLVLEDHGGAPVDRLLGRPMDVSHFLRIAVPLAGALRQVHERGLIHKDIKPANILVDAASGGVWLTGFGIASRLPREYQAPAPPEEIAGTLAYMAPEQTGRMMNRSVDSRSDLYALGVTFYEMLTGQLPFTAADSMEWVQCHIARQPVPPSEQVAALPDRLSAIVMKLLAKTAEERYQTAANPAFERRWGMRADTFIGKHVAEFLGWEGFEQTAKAYFDRCFAGEEVGYAEWFNQSPGRRYLSVTCSPLRPTSERVEAVRMELAQALPTIHGDRVQLQQVIINLVMNGIKAMQSVPDRPRELVIRSRQNETQQVLASVTDCGVGISVEDADRLFNPFFTTKSGGMGMGLSICRSIMEVHGGRLWVTANIPHGATFHLVLLVHEEEAS